MEADADHHIHLPSPSYWPIILAFVAAVHRLRRHLQPAHRRSSASGVLILAMFGWAMEPSVADDSDYDPVPPADDGPGAALATTGGEA